MNYKTKKDAFLIERNITLSKSREWQGITAIFPALSYTCKP